MILSSLFITYAKEFSWLGGIPPGKLPELWSEVTLSDNPPTDELVIRVVASGGRTWIYGLGKKWLETHKKTGWSFQTPGLLLKTRDHYCRRAAAWYYLADITSLGRFRITVEEIALFVHFFENVSDYGGSVKEKLSSLTDRIMITH